MYKLSARRDQEVIYVPGIPPVMARYKIPGASNAFHVSGENAIQLFQQIAGRHFDVWSMNFLVNSTGTLYTRMEKPVLSLHFALKNDFNYNLQGIGDIILPQRRFNLTFAPFFEGDLKVKANQHYWYFEVHPPLALLEELISSFPGLDRFINHVTSNKPAMLSRQHPVATAEMLDVIHSILHNQFKGSLRELYLEIKILELVLLSLHRSSQDKATSGPVILTTYDIEKVQEARNYLLEHIDDRTSIADLSRIVGINRNKLTGGFRQVHGITIFDFVIDVRMEMAKELLLDTETPIREIAIMVGYSKLSNFSTAFTRKFGSPPSVFRVKG